jgi:hypothetical protein
MTTPDQPIDDTSAIRIILDTLKKLPEDERAGVLRYVMEKLGLATTTPAAPAPGNPMPAAGGTGGGLSPNIRTFIETKAPSSDVQFATAVAYFNAFEAPQAARRAEITGDDLTEAARQANWQRLNSPSQTLRNATALGYVDKGSMRGAFRINTVGENLVAMAMPPTAAAAVTAPRRRLKKSAKPK